MGVPDGAIALELQWDTRPHDRPWPTWILALHAIVEQPGPHHSRYSTFEIAWFPAETLEARREARARAREIAGALPLHAPSVDDEYGQGGSAWIRAQPPCEPHPYEIAWTAHWWSDDGDRVEASGVERVVAGSGRDARIELQRNLAGRFPSRPLGVRVGGDFGTSVEGAAWPALLPDRETIRAIADGVDGRPSAIARALRAPGVTPRMVMLAFEASFRIWFDALAPLARWCKGELDDAALDDALALIPRDRRSWTRVRRLREADAAGKSVAAFLREEPRHAIGAIEVFADLRDALDVEFGAAKLAVDACRDPQQDAETDKRIDAARCRRT